ncbi:MAG TPA: helix-turn-helix transcriptional regulator [Gemmatimonadales bacterium]|nr:helix-turn-helix transcriptional regulator [Gemmatimonadales bacterium]
MDRPLTSAELFQDLRADVVAEVSEIRASLGLTQAELARRMGTQQAKVARIERGLENLRLETLARLAAALECTVFIAFGAPTDLNPRQQWVRHRQVQPEPVP